MVAPGDSATLYVARLEQRVVAFILDAVLLLSFLAVFFIIGALQALIRSDSGNNDLSDPVVYTWIAITLSWLAFMPLYYVTLWVWRGQTVGKMAVHIQVVRTDGEPVNLLTAVLRFVAYVISALPLFAGFFVALFQEDRRALHDLVAKTVVIDLP